MTSWPRFPNSHRAYSASMLWSPTKSTSASPKHPTASRSHVMSRDPSCEPRPWPTTSTQPWTLPWTSCWNASGVTTTDVGCIVGDTSLSPSRRRLAVETHGGLGKSACRLRDGLRDVSPTMHPTSVVVTPEAFQQLVHGNVQGCVLVVGDSLGPHDWSLDMTCDLDAVGCFGLALVDFVGDHYIEALYARCELRNLGQLVIQVTAKALGNLGVPSSDDDLHGCPPCEVRDSFRGPRRTDLSAAPPPTQVRHMIPRVARRPTVATPYFHRFNGGPGGHIRTLDHVCETRYSEPQSRRSRACDVVTNAAEGDSSAH